MDLNYNWQLHHFDSRECFAHRSSNEVEKEAFLLKDCLVNSHNPGNVTRLFVASSSPSPPDSQKPIEFQLWDKQIGLARRQISLL